MKSTKLVTSVAALSLMLAGAAFAQSYTLNGTAVPEDQVARIQAHCDMLMSGQDASGGVDASGTAATGDNSSASVAGTTGNGSLTDTSNEAGSTTATTSAGTGTTASSNDNGSGTSTDATAGVGVDATASAAGVDANASTSAAAAVDFTTLDVATIDMAACQAGGFSAMASQ